MYDLQAKSFFLLSENLLVDEIYISYFKVYSMNCYT